MIDKNIFAQLEHDVGSELAKQLMSVFIEEAESLVNSLCAESDNKAELQRLAHSLKSSAKSYGALELSHISEAIEQGVKSGSINNLDKSAKESLKQQSEQTLVHARTLVNG